MPTKSAAQERLMQGVAHNPAFAKKVGIPQSVGKEFVDDQILLTPRVCKETIEEIKDDTVWMDENPREDDADPCWNGYEQIGMKTLKGKQVPNCVPEKNDSEAWTKQEGKNKEGGLNEKGRKSYNKNHGAHLKRPQPEGGPRKNSFCARMKGMKEKLTSEETKHDPDSRINKSLKKWKCNDASEERLAEIAPTPPPVIAPIDPQGGAATRAAGIMFRTKKDGMVLLMRRGAGGDYPFHFSVPGGHLAEGEDPEAAARRETKEEMGIDYEGPLVKLYDDGQFVTYLADVEEQIVPKLNYEASGYVWCRPENAPQPLHPGLDIAFRVACSSSELDVAKLIAEGILSSPQVYANMHLLNLRITGTGLAFRSSIGEHVWRDAALYLNDDFLQRCNGLMVIMDHPSGSILDAKEFKDRAIGSIMYAYIKGDEVWGIAKVYDDNAMKEIMEGDISTSPSVVFDETSGNTTLMTESGEPLLIEGKAFLLDHIAIVTKERGSRGVWDKGGAPKGVELNNPGVSDMTDKIEAKADATGDKLDAILTVLGGLSARMDDMEKNLPAEPMSYAADKKKKRKDAEEPKHELKLNDDDEEEEMPMMDDDDAEKCDDDDEEEEMPEKMMKKDAKKKRKDAEGSDPKEEEPAGEMKPDDDDDKMAAKMDAMHSRFADAQAKADSVFAAFGKSASRPLQGESLSSYRKRLLRGLQGYSDAYKEINLRAISDNALLDIAEKQIFNDAMVKAKTPIAYGDALVEHRTTDRTGRTISTFTGPMGAWLDDFKVAPMRVTEFRTQNVTNYR
jgi:8-oxo-dGTP pyrophosphatase MutT (NUDIX family)